MAKECRLDWKTVKELEKQYMREQLDKAPEIKPRVIGVDEISVQKGHEYRIVVSDLERGVPIWFGGQDRTEESMDLFYAQIGPEKCGNIRLAVMDMWKAFENSAIKNAPQALMKSTVSPGMDASYAISIRQASPLPAASFRFTVARDTLAVRLILPRTGCIRDFHSQERAPCRAHGKEKRHQCL